MVPGWRRSLLAGAVLLGLSPGLFFAADPQELQAIDSLYLHRHKGLNLRESVARQEAMLEKAPQDAEILWRLGRGLVRVGEKQAEKAERIATYQRAEDLAKRACGLAPKSAEAHFWLGVAMGRRGQAKGILNSLGMVGPLKKEMRTVLELDHKFGGAHHVLGELYSQLPFFAGGSRKKALEEFEKAVELSPDYAVNYVSLAEAYLNAGRKEEAKLVLDQLFSLKNPSDPAEYPDNVRDGKALVERLKP